MDLHVVLCTVPDPETGAKLARALVAEKLAACVNIVPGLRSIYSWKGEIQEDPEALLVIKARRERFGDLSSRIGDLHPYDVPEIVALAPEDCHAAYLSWVLDVTK
jgi:periplasmic divalent cation tolerance protein